MTEGARAPFREAPASAIGPMCRQLRAAKACFNACDGVVAGHVVASDQGDSVTAPEGQPRPTGFACHEKVCATGALREQPLQGLGGKVMKYEVTYDPVCVVVLAQVLKNILLDALDAPSEERQSVFCGVAYIGRLVDAHPVHRPPVGGEFARNREHKTPVSRTQLDQCFGRRGVGFF